MSVIDPVMAEESLQVRSVRWINIRKTWLHIWDLLHSESDVNSITKGFVTAVDVKGCTLFVVVSLNGLAFIPFLLSWTPERSMDAFWPWRQALLDSPRSAGCPSAYPQKKTAPHPSWEPGMDFRAMYENDVLIKFWVRGRK